MNGSQIHKVDHLFLLIGTNPLPNYVAAQLLARQESQIFLVYSTGTDPVQQTLKSELEKLGFKRVESIYVEEARPEHIRNQIRNKAETLTGVVGLNYTGGTKAMSVHACLALEELTRHDPQNPRRPILANVQYSYLDARTLNMVIEDTHFKSLPGIPNVAAHISVKIEEVLALHNLHKMKEAMQHITVWDQVSAELAHIHTNQLNAQQWREWCNTHLRREDRPDKFKNSTALKQLTTDMLPFETLREAFKREYPDQNHPLSFEQLATLSKSRKADESLAKWFDGVWLEHYVFQQMKPLHSTNVLTDLALTINPLTNPSDRDSDFEFDVVGMRGYQMFALSVTSSGDAKLCKKKLLEAIVRAEQLGGSEARVALICCVDQPESLRQQVNELFHQTRLRIFGRTQLLDLPQLLKDWITE